MLHLSIVKRVSIGQVDFQDQQRDRNCEDAIAKCLKRPLSTDLCLLCRGCGATQERTDSFHIRL